MRKSVWLTIVLLSVLGLAARAEMVVTTADGSGADTFVGNDSNKGPNNNYGTGGTLDIRNYTNTRAHIGFARFDISSIAGVDPTGVQLKLWFTQAQNSKNWNIYAVNDNAILDNWNEMTITYNNCPWMLPAASGNWAMDMTKVTLLGTIYVPSGGYKAVTTAITPAVAGETPLESLIKADTNNLITLIFVGPNDGSGTQYYITSKEGAASTVDPNDFPPTLILPVEPNPFWASNPNPAMHQVVSTSLSQLCWTNPEPNDAGGVITCDVYFGTAEPNLAEPDYGLMTVAAGTRGTCVSLPTAVQPFTRYYWVVDVHDSSMPGVTHRGRVWSFNTFNQAPSVDAGADQFVWLGHLGDPASAAATITPTVSDDGQPFGTLSYLWEQVSGPALTISPNNTKDLSLVFAEAGSYVLRLTADDGLASNSDTLQIYVGTDACDAAKAKPGYSRNAMDFNNDCWVNLTDFASFAQGWLDCRSLDCP